MGMLRRSTVALSISFLLGCSSAQPPAAAKPTVFDPALQAEQRARDVQAAVDKNAEGTRKAVADQERGDPSP
jgi:hypothetical protein